MQYSHLHIFLTLQSKELLLKRNLFFLKIQTLSYLTSALIKMVYMLIVKRFEIIFNNLQNYQKIS